MEIFQPIRPHYRISIFSKDLGCCGSRVGKKKRIRRPYRSKAIRTIRTNGGGEKKKIVIGGKKKTAGGGEKKIAGGGEMKKTVGGEEKKKIAGGEEEKKTVGGGEKKTGA